MITIAPHGRYWAVYASEELVCLCLYKKGASEVKRRLEVAEKGASPEAIHASLRASTANANERKGGQYDDPTV